MDATDEANNTANGWPDRPIGEVFPEILDTIQTAQLLGFDKRGKSPEHARRSVLGLVKRGMPTLGRVGSTKLYSKAAVVDWLAQRGDAED